MKKIFALMFNMVIGLVLASVTGGGLLAAVGTGSALSLIRTGDKGLSMAIQKDIWESDIVEQLFADNAFLNFAYNADQYVLAGKVVHIPNAGAAPGVVTNRTDLPASVTQRTDVDITYAIDEITSNPVLIVNADTVELAYDKRNSVLGDTKSAISEAAALNILFKWSPTVAGQIIRTTGTAVLSHTDSATGNRKAFCVADVKSAQKLMNKNGVPGTDRYLMLDADMYDQLTADLTATQYRDFSQVMDPATGVVGKLYGFNILVRNGVMRYTNATIPVPVSWTTAGDANHNGAAIAWQKNSVERALGTVSFFERLGDPTFFGDIYSALVRLGGRIRRNDAKGVIAIVQAATA